MVRIAKEADGRVSIAVTGGKDARTAVVSPIEARLLAIKLLLAAEELGPGQLLEKRAESLGGRG
jgi:hypothetical protein